MNFHQLKYIVAVESHRNFARAAEYCEIAQSTLSKEIQRLEKEFDVMIFDRSRHPVVPTMKGIDLIGQAKIILEEQERFIGTARKKNNVPTGNYKLGVISIIATYLVPLFAQKFREKYSGLNLEILELNPSEISEGFESGTLDGAISFSPFPKEGFYERPVFEEEFVLYIGQDHYLLSLPYVKWADIPMDEMVLQKDFKTFIKGPELEQLKHDNRLTGKNYLQESLETIRKIIDRNGGITLIPEMACLYMGERRLAMVRHIEAPSPTMTINFVAPRGFEKNRISKVIIQEIKENLSLNTRNTLKAKVSG
ncbi:MAG TPA: LysR family transcriptional regulator [Salinimicrobium sp.]|nr:LysR family transcriptional regulator [Salinimicrobium sp.]